MIEQEFELHEIARKLAKVMAKKTNEIEVRRLYEEKSLDN